MKITALYKKSKSFFSFTAVIPSGTFYEECPEVLGFRLGAIQFLTFKNLDYEADLLSYQQSVNPKFIIKKNFQNPIDCSFPAVLFHLL